MKNGLTKTNCLFLLGCLFVGAFLALSGLSPRPVKAAAGINKTISFQGRLFNNQGAVVPDGFYNIEFKIYQDGDGQSVGDTTGSPAGSLKWTEDYLNQAGHGVKVVNGFLSVQLGSVTPFGTSIDWNQDTLWLSMNIAGTGSSCTPFSSCSPDGEMTPMQPMTASPYALNAGQLGGLTAGNFVQLAQGIQTDASNTNPSIYINKTGTAKILELQSNSTDILTVDPSGNTVGLGVTGSTNANSTIHIADSTAGIQTVTIGSTSSSSATTINGGSGGITLNGNTTIGGTSTFTVNGGLTTLKAGLSVQTGAIGTVGINIVGASGQTADLLDIQSASGILDKFTSAGVLDMSALPNNTTALKLPGGTVSFNGGAQISSPNSDGSLRLSSASGQSVQITTPTGLTVATSNTTGIALTNSAANGLAPNGYNVNFTGGDITNASSFGLRVQNNSGTTTFSVNPHGSTTITNYTGTDKSLILKGAASQSGDFFEVQDSSLNVLSGINSSGNLFIGKASTATGSLQLFNSSGSGSITLVPANPTTSTISLTLPADTTAGAILCTNTSASACNTNGALTNVAYLGQDQSFTGKNTFSRTGSGANDYSLGITGAPAASTTSSLVRIGGALSGGNGAANGGTYLSIVEPSSGAGSAADFLNLQNGSTVELQLSSAGNLTVGGTYNGNTFDNSGHLTFGNGGAATISSNGANNLTVDTGGAATLALGNSATTTNIATSNAAHTIGIGTGGAGTTTQAITIGAATNSSSTLTLQGGNGSSAILLQTGNNGSGVAGGIVIGNGSGANQQTITIGNNNSGSNIVNIGTGTSQDSVTIGDTTNANSSVSLKAGSTGGISLGANTTLSANSNFTYASGTGKFDASNASGTFDTTSGTNHLNGATTVTGTNTFTVNGGATTLNGATAGNGTAAKVYTNATTNVGLVVQGVSNQTAALLQLQDSSGAGVIAGDAGGNLELLGNLNNPYGGIGGYGNLVVQSEQLGTSWTATNITVTQNDGASNPAPDGNTTADKLLTSASGTHSLTQTYSSAGNNTYTFSIWLKAATPPQPVQLRIDSNGTPATGTVASFTVQSTWQRYSVTQTFTSGVSSITPTLLIANNNTSIVGWGAQLILGGSAGAYVRTGTAVIAAGSGIIDNQSAVFQALTNSATAYQFQNSSGVNVAAIDTSSNQLVLGSGSGSISGQVKFNYTGQTGSISLAPANPSSTGYTITLPAENGTICTTAASAACTAVYAPAGGGYVNFAPSSVQADASNNNTIFINKTSGTGNILELQKSASDVFKIDNSGNVTSTGQNTLSRSGTGASDYTFGVTGTTSATGSSSLVRIGGALTGGNGAVNGGTYLSIVEPSSGTGSAADFLNFQNGTTVQLQLASNGNLTVAGTYNGNTFDNTGHLTFGNAGAAIIKSNGANDITLDTGSSAAVLTLGNTAATTNIGTTNAAHAITIGNANNNSSTLALQGGNGSSAITLLTGNNGAGTAGSISIGNMTGANSQTISIGANSTASSTNIVQIGTGTSQDSVTIGDTTSASSAINLKAGSTGGITLTSSTTNINSATLATNQSTISIFDSTAATATMLQAATSISLGSTSGTVTIRNPNQIFGNAAGQGVFTNNGATFNSTLVVNDDSNGGTLGGTPSGGLTAAQSVDVYTSISINQTTAGQTITMPTPTASTNYGRVIYITNIGTASFIINSVTLNPGQGGTMIWSNTTGGASWQFAGAGADAIANQNSIDQTANFRISGTGRANTSFTAPSFDSITGVLNIGSANATTVNIGNSGSTPTTNINLLTKGAGTTVKTATDVSTAFQVQNNAGANVLQVDTASRNIKIYENNGTTNYALIYFDTATATANYTASAGTVAVGRGAGAITVTAGSGSSVNITANAASTWKTTAGTLSLQSGTGTSDYLILNAGGSNQVQVNGSAVVKLGSASADPTCTTAAIYYNTTNNLFRGCQNGTWATLSSTTQTLQNAYNQSTGSTTPEVKLNAGGTDTGAFDIQDADSSLAGVIFAVRGSNAGGLGTSLFNVNTSNSTINIGTSANTTALLVLGLDTNSTFNAGTTTSAASEVDGAMFYSSSDHNFLCGTAGQWITCNGLLYSNTTASSAVNTCTNACAAFSTNNSTMIPPNYCQAGRVIRINARGHYSVASATTPTLQMGVYYGTNSTTAGSDTQIGASTPAPASASGATNQFWALDYTITCFDTTHMMGEGTYTFQNNTTATTSMLVLNVLSTSSTAVTTTSAKALYIFPTWSASSASNTVTLDQLVVTGN